MPVVSQAQFDDLIRVKAIAADGDILYTVKYNGQTYLPGGEAFSVDGLKTDTAATDVKPEPAKAAPKPRTHAPKEVKDATDG